MLKHRGSWKIWVIVGFIVVIAFAWLNELWDLPAVLLDAPPTPINWRESLIETFFSLFMLVMCWIFIRGYELRWLETTQKLETLATTDELSGLLNRREFLARAEKEFERARRFGHPLSIAILDLDEFKEVNDQFGHLAGDRVIRAFAGEIHTNIRQQDLVGRIGGDEFVIVLIESTGQTAKELVGRIQISWQDVEIVEREGEPIKVTFSTGITSAVTGDKSLLDSLQRADQALYAAKSNGANKIVIA